METQIYLHDAIDQVLRKHGGLSAIEIENEINWNRPSDGKPVQSKQINARVRNHPELFCRGSGNIRLVG